MFKKIALTAGVLAASLTAAHAGNRDLSAFDAKTKARGFVALNYYKNHCATLSPALGQVHDQLEQMTDQLDQAELAAQRGNVALIINLGNDANKAELCTDLEPVVQKLTKVADAMPVVTGDAK